MVAVVCNRYSVEKQIENIKNVLNKYGERIAISWTINMGDECSCE